MSTKAAAAALLLALAGLARPAGAEPREEVQACADRAGAGTRGQKMEELCPHLSAALDALALSALLDAQSLQHLNAATLTDLAALSSRYAGARTGLAPNTASLAAIAEEVNGRKAAAPVTWWERLKSWAADWFARHSRAGDSWLSEWLRRLSASTVLLTVILYGCVALVAIGAAAVVFIELRAAGLLRGHARRQVSAQRAAAAEGAVAVEGTGDARTGVASLLRRLVARLVQTRRLQFERAMTHRELIARSVFDSPEQRQVFARVAQAAESLLYGGGAAADTPQPVMDQGHSLLGQLGELSPRDPL